MVVIERFFDRVDELPFLVGFGVYLMLVIAWIMLFVLLGAVLEAA